jgi:hypothetical protein
MSDNRRFDILLNWRMHIVLNNDHHKNDKKYANAKFEQRCFVRSYSNSCITKYKK